MQPNSVIPFDHQFQTLFLIYSINAKSVFVSDKNEYERMYWILLHLTSRRYRIIWFIAPVKFPALLHRLNRYVLEHRVFTQKIDNFILF